MLYPFIIAALVKLLVETENPRLCAGIYTAFVAAISLMLATSPDVSLLSVVVTVLFHFAYSFVTFGF